MGASVRQKRGEATRSEILTVARRLFSDFGYHNTGISDIQAATGLTKGAFYHHFRTKQELALAVLDEAKEAYARHMIEPAKEEASGVRQLITLLGCAVALNCQPEWQNCRLLATLCAEMTAVDGELVDAVRSVYEQLFETVASMVAEAQKEGQAADGPPEVWAQLLLSTLMGLLLIRKIGAAQTDMAAAVEHLKRALLPRVA